MAMMFKLCKHSCSAGQTLPINQPVKKLNQGSMDPAGVNGASHRPQYLL
jgi:hypothetical protein